jgi:hypothetical protein
VRGDGAGTGKGVGGDGDLLSCGLSGPAPCFRAESGSLENSLFLIAEASFWMGLEDVGDAGCCGGGSGAFSFPFAILLDGFEGLPAAFAAAAAVLHFFAGGTMVTGIGVSSAAEMVVGKSVSR